MPIHLLKGALRTDSLANLGRVQYGIKLKTKETHKIKETGAGVWAQRPDADLGHTDPNCLHSQRNAAGKTEKN
jgi:hypothetical protein